MKAGKEFWSVVPIKGTTITAYGQRYSYQGMLNRTTLKAKTKRGKDGIVVRIPMKYVTHINGISQAGV